MLILLLILTLPAPGGASQSKDDHSDHSQTGHAAMEAESVEKDPHAGHGQAMDRGSTEEDPHAGHGKMAQEAMEKTPSDQDPHQNHFKRAAEIAAASQAQVEVQERIGQRIPLDIELIDVTGTPRPLEALLNKPTILVQIYYTCPGACSVIQGNLAHALKKAPYALGDEYDVISVSFDATETSEHARQAADTYRNIIADNPNRDSWRFFTATPQNIRRLTEATGFKFVKRGPQDFIHPNLVTVITGDGLIIRYLYGTEYLPFDIGMALSEAHKGLPGVSIKKFLSYCFEYDPEKKTYAFSLFKISGAVILTLLAVFLFFLLRRGKSAPAPDN
jgi:protein SCO1/2